MTADFFNAYTAANHAVPLVKALASLLIRDAAPGLGPARSRVWSLVPAPSAGTTVPNGGRGLLSRPGSQPFALDGLTAEDHVVRISILHPDDRLAYLSGIGFSDNDLAASAQVVDRWLDMSKSSLEETTGKAFEAGEGLDWIMDAWRETNPYEALGKLILENSISQPEPLVCYAVCSATELALSMLMLLQLDGGAEPVPGGTDAEWAEDDERTASLGMADEVSQWPK